MLSAMPQLCLVQEQATEPGAKVAELMPSKIALHWETAYHLSTAAWSANFPAEKRSHQ